MIWPRYRVNPWFSLTGTRATSYGVQVQSAKGKRFMHCSVTVRGVRRSAIYKTKAHAEKICTKLNSGIDCWRDLHRGLVPLANRKGGAS